MLVATDLQRPNAVTQLQIVGQQAGVPVWAPEPGNGVGDPVQVARVIIPGLEGYQFSFAQTGERARTWAPEMLERRSA